MIQNEFYDGILYQIEYQKHLSNNDYTQHHVYHVTTEEENYPKAHRAIESIMNDGSWREGEWKVRNKQQPSIANALHSYHKFSYDEEKGVYIYTFVRPYDD